MTVFGSADLCTADRATERRIWRIKEAARKADAARAQREAVEKTRTRAS